VSSTAFDFADPAGSLARLETLARSGRRREAREIARVACTRGATTELLGALASWLPEFVGEPPRTDSWPAPPARAEGRAAITALAQDLAGAHLAVGTRAGRVWLRELDSGEERPLVDTDGAPIALAFAPRGEVLAIATGRGQVLRVGLAGELLDEWSIGRSLGLAALWAAPGAVLLGSHGAFQLLPHGAEPEGAEDGLGSLAPPAWSEPARRRGWLRGVARASPGGDATRLTERAALCVGDWTGRLLVWPAGRQACLHVDPDGTFDTHPVPGRAPALPRAAILAPGGTAMAYVLQPGQGLAGVVLRRRLPAGGWGGEEVHLRGHRMRSLAAAPDGSAILVGGGGGSVYRLPLPEVVA
jgi:hypothetical protein